ncbi:helix-turn-helix transcriptional regulator [Salinisphaera sp. Q1T1-3]|uniref:ArsR/SmtB family transcription factor n=1 Tax=Salinisphaera sp. Q1T1-3 TaxID=2321229 RepID=UPI000E7641AF|nr:metalloregulator ArsR/SmtB family transcription factor [Salinisphaera sp. Q1T1-3]RJS94802.1 transcriptional regulator [Salinisphaera sp. Q1T1-3]
MDKNNAIDCFAALAQQTRLETVRLLIAHEPNGLPAGEIARQLDVPHNTLSTHLRTLTRAGLAVAHRESRSIIYRANLATVDSILGFLLHDCCGNRPSLCWPAAPTDAPD